MGITWELETGEAAIEGCRGPGLLALRGLNTEELGHVLQQVGSCHSGTQCLQGGRASVSAKIQPESTGTVIQSSKTAPTTPSLGILT